MEPVIAVIFLITSYLFGYVLSVRFFPKYRNLLRIASAYIVGILVSQWLVLIMSLVLYRITESAMVIAFTVATVILLVFVIHQRALFKLPLGLKPSHVIFFTIIFVFSWILFSSTFGYDTKSSEMRISRLIWSDFGFHIPVIRSFSFGNNLSLEHPLYAHEIVRYHFMFDFMVGILEKMGIPIDYALNIPSALSYTCLIVLIYYFSKKLFCGSRFVGSVSVLLFLLNSSLSFVEFLKKYPPKSVEFLVKSWWNLQDFVAFGPWDGNIISGFWTWNIYTNQRHLALGFALVLLVLIHYIDENINKEKGTGYLQKAFIGLITGLLVLWHGQAFICLYGFLWLFFLLFPEREKNLLVIFVASLIALPQILWLQQSSPDSESQFSLSIGYLVTSHLMRFEFMPSEFLNRALSFTSSFLRYWFFNLGMGLITITISFFLVDTQRKKIFIIFFSLFVLGNLFRFSPEVAANHKFFNEWVILVNSFSAYVVYRVFYTGWLGRLASILLLICLTISGLVDAMPIKNDYIITLKDVRKEPLAKWIMENTDKDAVFLTTIRIYNPVSFTGRRAMMGWPYFAWSSGYTKPNREKLVKKIYETSSKEELCSLLRENRIDYVVTERQPEKDRMFTINQRFFNSNFRPVFYDRTSGLGERVFETNEMCKKME
jgi:hypothetical protein